MIFIVSRLYIAASVNSFFLVANVRVRENRRRQIYDMGKPYPQVIRENVLDLHNNGLSKLCCY